MEDSAFTPELHHYVRDARVSFQARVASLEAQCSSLESQNSMLNNLVNHEKTMQKALQVWVIPTPPPS